MGSYFTKEAIVALLKKLFVNWWKSKGKKIAQDEWGQINDLINERIAEVVGPRNSYMITTENGNIYAIKVDNEGVVYTEAIVKRGPAFPSDTYRV